MREKPDGRTAAYRYFIAGHHIIGIGSKVDVLLSHDQLSAVEEPSYR